MKYVSPKMFLKVTLALRFTISDISCQNINIIEKRKRRQIGGNVL